MSISGTSTVWQEQLSGGLPSPLKCLSSILVAITAAQPSPQFQLVAAFKQLRGGAVSTDIFNAILYNCDKKLALLCFQQLHGLLPRV